MNEIEEKKAQRVIACLRGEVERQFSKEYGLYYKSFKSIFITRNPQRNQLVKSIENIFNQALKERWALHTIKTALNNIADEAQSHHRSRSGTRLLGCLVNATCDFKLTMSKVLAKFPHTGEAINEKGESFNKSWRKI